MSRIIINNKSGVSDTEALWLVISVVKGGRISDGGKKYCLCSVGKSSVILSNRTKDGTDTFTITKK